MGLVVGYLVTAWVFRASLRATTPPTGDDPHETPRQNEHASGPAHFALLVKSLVVTLGAVALFFAGAPMGVVALGAAALLLLDRVKPEKVYREIDWGLLVMFAGLFVVVRAFAAHVVQTWGVEHWTISSKATPSVH